MCRLAWFLRFGECTAGELLEFTNRQLKITRVYAPHLWKPLLIGSLLFCAVFFGGLVLVIARALLGLPCIWRPLVLPVSYLFRWARQRLTSVSRRSHIPLANYQKHSMAKSLPAQLLLWPVALPAFTCVMRSLRRFRGELVARITYELKSATEAVIISRRITWRGITYELKSPTEAVIISRESSN